VTDLAAFLSARLDEDEAVAREVSRRWPWDPARVLADVEAKRAIVALHASAEVYGYRGGVEDACTECGSLTATSTAGDSDYAPWPCDTLRLLAQPYRDHADWRAEWAT
jgi:hypothetical protein